MADGEQQDSWFSRWRASRRYERQEPPVVPTLPKSLRFLSRTTPEAMRDMKKSAGTVVLNAVAGLSHPMMLSTFTTATATGLAAGTPLGAAAPIAGYLGAMVAEPLTSAAASHFSIRASGSFLERARMKVWEHAIKLMMIGQGIDRSTLETTSNISIRDVRTAFLNDARQVVQHSTRMGGVLGATLLFHLLGIGDPPPFGLTGIMLAPVVAGTATGAVMIRNGVRTVRKAEIAADEELARMHAEITPEIMRMLLSAGADQKFFEELKEKTHNASDLTRKRNAKEALASTAMMLISGAGSLGATVLGVKAGIAVTPEEMISLVAINLSITGAAVGLPSAASSLSLAVTRAATEVKRVLDIQPNRLDDPSRPAFERSAERPTTVALDQVAYTHPPRDEGSQPFRVHDINMHLPERGLVALVGENGSGKSTTLAILADIVDPETGTALINGQNRQSFNLLSRLRETISVPQHVELFGNTLGDVMGLFCDLNDSAQKQKAEQLLVDLGLETLMKDKHGDRTNWEERTTRREDGTPIPSGGQLQRLVLASHLADTTDRPIFIDEPTNHLGTREKRMVWDVLEREAEGRCIVAATQNADTMKERDIPVAVMAPTSEHSATLVQDPIRPSELPDDSPFNTLLEFKAPTQEPPDFPKPVTFSLN
jgi:ABC-type multidrug transport system fused ATPase/permease subunit